MLSRRSFLKVIGIGAAAVGAGYGTGKLLSNDENRFSINAFIPADELIIKDILNSLNKKYSYSSVIIFATGEIKKQLIKLLPGNNELSGHTLIIQMKEINNKIDSDILISDQDNFIYNPDKDFDLSFNTIRERIKNRSAGYFLSAEYKQRSIVSSLFSSNKKVLMIETEKGISDKISLDKSYKSIELDGITGKTILRMANGFVSVQKSSCRNKLCEYHGQISEAGNAIACAPNRLLLRIENA